MMYVILTVDWEVNCGKWRRSEVDYGGVIVGTPSFEEVLDDLEIPCTWFVETHNEYVQRDIPKQFPELIKQLAYRKRDEIGTHIHLGKYNAEEDKWKYPAQLDRSYFSKQIGYAKDEMKSFGIKPVSFRSGAYYKFPGLPKILKNHGYINDSSRYYDGWVGGTPSSPEPKSFFDIKSWRNFIISKTFLRNPMQPYECDEIDCKKGGKSGIVEFPCSMHIMYLLQNDNLYDQFFSKLTKIKGKDLFIVLYFHIFEITDYRLGPNEKTNIDHYTLIKMKKFLDEMMGNEINFLTMTCARDILNEV